MILRNEELLRLFTLVFIDLMIRGFELVTREFELVALGFELITRRFELLTRGYELVTRRFKLLIRNSQLVICKSCFTISLYLRHNLPKKIKYGAYVINLDEYADVATHCFLRA